MVEDISLMNDFGGHYILGPLFVFLREVFAVGFGVFSGVYLVPKNKNIIFAGFIILWIIFLLILLILFLFGLSFFSMELTTEELFRFLIEIIAQLIGLLLAGIFIWKEKII
jgi:hypothetical protein